MDWSTVAGLGIGAYIIGKVYNEKKARRRLKINKKNKQTELHNRSTRKSKKINLKLRDFLNMTTKEEREKKRQELEDALNE